MYCEMHSIPKKLLGILLFSVILTAKDFNVKSEIDQYEYLIGDHINLELSATLPENYDIVFPNLSDSVSNLEIIKIGVIDTSLLEETKILKRTIVLTQFDSGSYQIPKFTFIYDKKGSESGELIPKTTNFIDFKINTVAIDTTKAFVDIKGIKETPFSIWEYQNEILIGIGILILIIVVIYFLRKYLKKPKEEPKNELFNPEIEPHVLAIGALKKLKSRELWQGGLYKEYYTELTDVLKVYLVRCFKIDALEMLSSEIIESLKKESLSEEIVREIENTFNNADLAKFAKFTPHADDNIQAIESAFEFIELTKHKSIESMNKKQEVSDV